MNDALAVRPCPFCSQAIESTANLCAHCGRFSTAANARPIPSRDRRSLIQKWNEQISRWEASRPELAIRIARMRQNEFTIPSRVRLTLAGLLFVLAAIAFTAWFKGNWYGLRGVFALTVCGLAVLLYRHLVRRDTQDAIVQTGDHSPDCAIRLLGFDINVAAVQVIAVIAMLVFAVRWELAEAKISAGITLICAIALHQTSWNGRSKVLAVISVLYVLFLWSMSDTGFFYLMEQDASFARRRASIIPLKPFVFALLILAALPPLQLVRAGRLGLGRLRGDFSFRIFGSNIAIAATSSILLGCFFISLWALAEMPLWVEQSLPNMASEAEMAAARSAAEESASELAEAEAAAKAAAEAGEITDPAVAASEAAALASELAEDTAAVPPE